MEPLPNDPGGSLQPERLICLREMSSMWDKVAADRHFQSDSDVACFLLRYYEDTFAGNQSAANCVDCGTPLSLSCGKCGTNIIQKPHQHEEQWFNSKITSHSAWNEVTECWATADTIMPVANMNDMTETSTNMTGLATTEATSLLTRSEVMLPSLATSVSTNSVMSQVNFSHLDVYVPGNSTYSSSVVGAPLPSAQNSNAQTEQNSFENSEGTAEQNNNPMPAIEDSSAKTVHEEDPTDTQSMYRCLECGAGFQKKSVMILHLQRHGGRHACQHCGSEFTSALGLTRHLDTGVCKNISSIEVESIIASVKLLKGKQKKVKCKPSVIQGVKTEYSGKSKNACKFCGKLMASQSHLRRHVLIHTGEKPFGCQECGASFNQRSGLLGHMQHRHAKGKPVKCGSCNERFFSNAELDRHACCQGGNVFSDIGNISSNPLAGNETPTQPEQIALSACAAVQSLFFESQEYKFQDDHHPPSEDAALASSQPKCRDERPHVCLYCKAEFASSDLLKSHIQKHTGRKEFKCPYCDAAYSESHYLAKHLRKHTQPKAIMVECKTCKRTLSGPRSLEQHVCAKCDICQAIFKTPHKLKEHVRTHTGEKPYECAECGKKFAKQDNLKQHKKRHAGERSHMCQHCGMAFTTPSGLYHHRFKHSDVKPHKCSVCSKAYREGHQLTVHMRSHTQEKPYKCSHCDARFTMKSSLNGHMRTHTGEKPYACSHCGRRFANASNRNAHVRTHK